MNKINLYRLIVDIILLGAVFNGWWFLALPIAIVYSWYFDYFIEIIIAGVIYDSLFSGSSEFIIYDYIGYLISVLTIIITSLLKIVVRV